MQAVVSALLGGSLENFSKALLKVYHLCHTRSLQKTLPAWRRSFCLEGWKKTSSVNKITRDIRIGEWPCISKLPQSLWKCSMTLGTWYSDPYLCHGNNVHMALECGQSLCSGSLISPSSVIKWVSDFHKTWLSPSKHPPHLIALLRNEN